MFFHGKAYAGLCAGNFETGCHFCHARIVEVAFDFNAETFEGSLADSGGCHGDVGYYHAYLAIVQGSMECFHGVIVGVENVLHVEVGSGVDGV